PSFYEEMLGSIRVIRYKQYTPKNPSFLKRVIHIIDFTLGTWRNLKKVKECDLVISVIPFTSSAWLGNKLSRKLKSKHWIHIQDFEFDAAFQSGLTNQKNNKGFLHKGLMRLETKILNKADCVSTISHNMIKKLLEKTNSKTYYLPNWIEPKRFDFKGKHPLLQSNKFTILYSGNIGDKQDWNFFLEILANLDFDTYKVVIVGDGSKKAWLQDKLSEFDITIHKPVPYSELHLLLKSADVHILLQKTSVLDTVMPSKVLGMMASARPSIVSGHQEAEVGEILNSSKGGFYFSDNNTKEIANHIQRLKEERILADRMGRSAQEYVHAHFSKEPILEGFVNEINTL
ncbi:MAG: glycosyltransferase, partial [Bacteroidota bacterium]